jgi:hypothetical protein
VKIGLLPLFLVTVVVLCFVLSYRGTTQKKPAWISQIDPTKPTQSQAAEVVAPSPSRASDLTVEALVARPYTWEDFPGTPAGWKAYQQGGRT